MHMIEADQRLNEGFDAQMGFALIKIELQKIYERIIQVVLMCMYMP